MMTSWSSAPSAVTPNLTSRNRYVIQSMIPIEPTRIRMRAWLIRSELTTAPIVVRLRCSAIGPSSCWRATAPSPSFPSVGILVLPVTTLGDAEGAGDAPGEPEGAGEPDGVADAD